uniref:BRCT domain-containing protein n=1 Tax=Peronospora matthiolae TaxID=2874970 RepID=A0AAV1V4L4_9STRA
MYGVAVENRRRLLANFSVLITNHKSLLPPVDDLINIIKYAGGKATSKGKPAPGDIVISSEAALATAAVRKQLVDVNPEHIYSSELILRSVLQQRVDLDNYRVRAPRSGESKIR